MRKGKRISGLLTFCLAAGLMLCACGNLPETSENGAGKTGDSYTATSTSAGEADRTKEDDLAKDADFSQVLVDDDNLKFEITGIDHDGMWGYTWKVTLENKTSANLMFSLENVSVNGVMVDPFWAETVAAGKKSNTSISWSTTDFEKNDIEKVTDVALTLRVYDADHMEPEYLNQEFSVYPYGEENAENNSKEASESDTVLFDNDQCSMRITGYDPDGEWGYTMKVTLVNKTDRNLMFSVNNASINGTMCDPFWSSEVAAGKTSNQEITWMTNTLEEAGIDKDSVHSIDLPIKVYPSDDYTADDYVNQTFTVTP